VVKHAHHNFDIDHPGKDSYELRVAGAEQVVAVSRKRIAWIREYADDRQEPSLLEALQALECAALDLVLVEGFKSESFPKIEVHRPTLGKPLLYPGDDDIIAIATDGDIAKPRQPLQQLDLNRPEEIAAFILRLFP
jgi:molybdopterin-guanine dinucleotide biosynthesis protein MobB